MAPETRAGPRKGRMAGDFEDGLGRVLAAHYGMAADEPPMQRRARWIARLLRALDPLPLDWTGLQVLAWERGELDKVHFTCPRADIDMID